MSAKTSLTIQVRAGTCEFISLCERAEWVCAFMERFDENRFDGIRTEAEIAKRGIKGRVSNGEAASHDETAPRGAADGVHDAQV